MRKFIGVLFMLAAIAMIGGAGWLIYANDAEETMAAQSADSVVATMINGDAAMGYEPIDTTPMQATPEPEVLTEVPEMTTMIIDGDEYIGYLELPTIEIKLPIMSDWNYVQLKKAPCRYWGSAYDNSMVICAHNYERHFGLISTLEIGAPVQFVDADGNIYKYVVAKHEILERTGVDEMLEEDWDLTLFTCTYGGASRVTVRLKRVLAY